MNLSAHFTIAELAHSDTAVRLGIDNTPSEQVIKNARVAAACMEQVRVLLRAPIHVNSWFRCEALERVLCKKDFEAWCYRHKKNVGSLDLIEAAWRVYFARKQHPLGYSIDFTAPAYGAPQEIVRVIRDSGLPFDQLIFEGRWVHIGFGPQMRRQVLSATFTNGTPSYAAGIAA